MKRSIEKSICLIPARGNSKGVKKKNIRSFGNKPLIAHTIESALDSKLFEHVIVSTDSQKIASIAKKFGAEVPFIRPKKLASDKAAFDDALIHAVKELSRLKYEFEIVVTRDCTAPFIDKKDMRGALNLFKKSKCDAVFTVNKCHPNPYFGMFEQNSKKYLIPSKKFHKPLKRRQDAPIVYQPTGVYINSKTNLLKTGKMFTDKILPYEISTEHGYLIDYEIQFTIAEILYNLRKQSKIDF
jgi:CMP-N,N'-diacetyllegionaminic acid synthase